VLLANGNGDRHTTSGGQLDVWSRR